nr:MAG TPA: YopX protein [Caudoviricetes sp.]
MREIIFRGKRVDNEEWVYDNSVLFFAKTTKIYGALNKWREIEVIPETIGQFTGLTDKNGKKIFEGDIVKTTSVIGKNIYEVCFSEARRGWFPFACGDGCGCCEDEVECPEYVEIIGNIYDNKEILEDKE